MKRKFLTLGFAGIILASSLLTGCAGKDQNTAETENPENTEMTENAGQSAEDQKQTGIAGESASDSQIDFTALQAENPDIFGWLYIPGTGIDDPILQSEEADDYYETRDAYGRDNAAGALGCECVWLGGYAACQTEAVPERLCTGSQVGSKEGYHRSP